MKNKDKSLYLMVWKLLFRNKVSLLCPIMDYIRFFGFPPRIAKGTSKLFVSGKKILLGMAFVEGENTFYKSNFIIPKMNIGKS